MISRVGFQSQQRQLTKNQKRLIKQLSSYPAELLEQLAAISRMAHEETRETPQSHAPDIATLMKRPHILAAIELGKKYGRVKKFNELVIDLNKARLAAFRTGERSAIDRAQTPIADIGIALREVLQSARENVFGSEQG